MTKILGISGRKQSGKNTIGNFLHGMKMMSVGIFSDFKFNDNGKLVVPSLITDKQGNESTEYGIFDIDRNDARFCQYMAENVWPFIKMYSFADLLKMNVCMEVLGLSHKQCYGTDADKNTTTHISWDSIDDRPEGTSGAMTAREVMQYVGTNFFRKIYKNVWAESTIRRIEAEGTALAVICDCRFPNEVEAIQKAGGKVIRLPRNNHANDEHASETALDKENFDWKKFDVIIDNQDMNIKQTNDAVYNKLSEWGWVEMEYEIG